MQRTRIRKKQITNCIMLNNIVIFLHFVGVFFRFRRTHVCGKKQRKIIATSQLIRVKAVASTKWKNKKKRLSFPKQ